MRQPRLAAAALVMLPGRGTRLPSAYRTATYFGERTPSREPWLELVITHLLISTRTFMARTATCDKRHRHTLTNQVVTDILTYCHHFSSKFVARNVRKRADIGITPLPAMPVAATQSRRFNTNDCPIGFRCRIWNSLQERLLAKAVIQHGLHNSYFPSKASLVVYWRSGHLLSREALFSMFLRFRSYHH